MTKTETHTNKTILRVLLAALAVLLLCGAAVGAVAGEAAGANAGSWSGGVFTPDQTDGYKTVEDLDKLATELNAGQSGTAVASGLTLTLLKDVKLGGTLKIGSVDESNPIILDLGGNVLSMNITEGTASVITLDTNHKYLKLQDTYTGSADHYFTYKKDGAWTYKSNTEPEDRYKVFVLNGSGDDKFTREAADKAADDADAKSAAEGKNYSVYIKVTGGCITGGTGTPTFTPPDPCGGGVYISGGTFTMTGGNIVGNTSNGLGGGVFVDIGTFNMTNGSITGNIDSNSSGGGGGVGLWKSKFTMSGDAKITGNTSSLWGGGVYVNGDTFTMSGSASITENTSSQRGGGVNVQKGTFTMTGGTISKNTATNDGGGVNVQKGTFTMTGGTISENTVTKYGGGVRVNENGTFTMSGDAKITGNTAQYNGGGVYVSGTFNVSGSPKISDNTQTGGTTANNVYLSSGKSITVTGALNGASIGIASPQGGKFGTFGPDVTTADKTAAAICFHQDSDNTKSCLVYENGLYWPVAKIGTSYYATVQVAVDAASPGDTITMIDDSTEPMIIVSNKTVTLDLGGHVLKNDESGPVKSVIRVVDNGNLTLTDTHTASDLHYFKYHASNAWEYIKNPTTADVTGATPLAEFKRSTVAENDVISVEGGCITGGRGAHGGGVYYGIGKFNMSGGNIVGNYADEGGGVLGDDTITFKMTGGTIAGNYAAQSGGGGVRLDYNSLFEMSGGSIIGNTSDSGGGGVFVIACSFTLSNGKIAENKSSIGGGVFATTDSCQFTMIGGSITNNTTDEGGGGVFCDGGARFCVSGSPVIKDNTSTGGNANNVLLSLSTLKLTGHFYGEIYIYTEDTPSGQFGTADEAFEGADHFISDTDVDGKHYVGELVPDTKELVWGETPKTISRIHDEPVTIGKGTIAVSATSAADGAKVRLTVTPDDGYQLKAGFPKVTGVSEVSPVEGEPNVYKFTMPEAEVTVTAEFELIPASKPSKKSQGSSIWLTAEPTVAPTPIPTATAVPTPDVPQVNPANPSETPAKTPVPFIGVLAGLGAAAAVFGLRMRR